MTVIGLIGKKQRGKDTVLEIINTVFGGKHQVIRIAFADAIYEEVAKACGVTVEFVKAHKLLFRPIMQWWGNEFRRGLSGNDYWMNQLLKKANSVTDSHAIIVVPDVRFVNEADAITYINGSLIRIVRPSLPDDDNHPSEREQDLIVVTRIIHNVGTIEDLKKATIAMLKTLTIT